MFQIDESIPAKKLTSYLQNETTFLKDLKTIEGIEVAGQGNMNVVLRVKTSDKNFILKQSRPFVNKYPNIPAPLDRIEVEQQFYYLMDGNQFFPKVLEYISKDHILILEDLGKGEDLTSIYQSESITPVLIRDFTLGLYNIHKKKVPPNYPKNTILRQLNHQHIFILPFIINNNFCLDNVQHGLESLAAPFKKNNILKNKIQDAGKEYLKQGNTILHGDYYPGSWMRVGENLYIIDPEFSFVGPREFDLGVMSAHLIISSGNSALIHEVLKAYPLPIQLEQIRIYCGIEIIRRLIGLAQLPINRSLQEKKVLLALAEELIQG